MAKIRSHIIPKFYLEQFATKEKASKPGWIWVFERGKEPDRRTTKVQGTEKGYFAFTHPDGTVEESAESRLAKLETECDDVLVSSKSDLFAWSARNRKQLAFYAAFLYSRASQRRNFNEKHWSDIYKELDEALQDEEFAQELATHYGAKGDMVISADQLRAYIKPVILKAEEPAAAKNLFIEDLILNTDMIKELLLKKAWQIWKAPAGHEFVTSDNPLVTFVVASTGEFAPGFGFGRPDSLAAFPLAPTACLVVGARGPQERCTVDENVVRRINSAVISSADKYVYAKTTNEKIQEVVQQLIGAYRFGENAFFLPKDSLPSVKTYLRHILRIGSGTSRKLVDR